MTTIFIWLIAIVLIAIGTRKAYQNTKQININTISVPHKKISQLTILHLSDIHLENISVSPEQLLWQVKDQNIDLIALTGDFLDRKRSIPKLIPYLEALKEINPKYGTFAVFGNHDYVLRNKDFQTLKQVLEDNDCITLQNQHSSIKIEDETLNIIGIDDYSTRRSNIKKSYQNLPEGYNLILTHDPNIVLEMPEVHYDYLLSGHFHGGQIYWPKPYHLVKMGKLARKRIIKGLHYHNGKPFYISEGLGQTGVNIRVKSRPEITFHKIGGESLN